MRRMPGREPARPKQPFPKEPTPTAEAEKAGGGKHALEERIERLEKRLDETLANGGASSVRQGEAIDDSATADPLRRAVDRSNNKREAGK